MEDFPNSTSRLHSWWEQPAARQKPATSKWYL